MNNFISYIIESGISLGLLSLVYFVFLRHETFFRANRLFLLFAVLFSSILPLLHLKVYGLGNLLLSGANPDGAVNMLETITVNGSVFSRSLADLISASQLLVFGYLTGAAVVGLLVLFRIFQIIRKVWKGQRVAKDGITFVYTDEESSPYSFLHYLFVSKTLENKPGWEKMLAHESEHICQGHTVDILLLELISIFQWFNPFFWLLRRVIKENHEYMADRAVLNKGVAIDLYKQVLVSQCIGNQFSIANNFNATLIKSRLKMMTKIKSSNSAKLRYIMGGIMAVALLLVFACENKESTISKSEVVEKGVQIRSETGEQPLVLIDGEIADMDAMDKLDPKAIESIDVLKNDNQALVERYGEAARSGAVIITLKSNSTEVSKNNIDEVAVISYGSPVSKTHDDVFALAEEMPEFPGGDLALRKFIAQNVKYPEDARENGIKGKVYVTFVVEKDGGVGRTRIARGVAPSLDQEALRVVRELPNWKPARERGEPVAVEYTVPINFVLQ